MTKFEYSDLWFLCMVILIAGDKNFLACVAGVATVIMMIVEGRKGGSNNG